jgi:hypothetical protein
MARSDTRSLRLTPAARNSSAAGAAITPSGSTVTRSDDVRYLEMIAAFGSLTDQPLEFKFAFPPQQISYSEMSPEITQIRRPGRKPLVAFSAYRSRQVSIEFLIAVPFDGMFLDVEGDLDLVRRISQSGRPVTFVYADQFLGSEFAETVSESAPFWSITDLSFESMRRNAAGKIVSAQVSMSLVENINPDISIVELPPIEYTDDPKPQNPDGSGGSKEEDFIKWTDAWAEQGGPLIGDQ